MGKKNMINDEALEKVSGGVLTDEDKAWVEDLMWYCVENDYSWSDVVDYFYRDIEPYCNKVNAARPASDHVAPVEISNYMKEKFFEVGELHNSGYKRKKRKKR